MYQQSHYYALQFIFCTDLISKLKIGKHCKSFKQIYKHFKNNAYLKCCELLLILNVTKRISLDILQAWVVFFCFKYLTFCLNILILSLLNCVPWVLKPCSPANMPCVLTCSRANVSCMLMCSRTNVPCALTCSLANVFCVLTHSSANVPCELTCSRANVPCELTCSCANVSTCLVCLRSHMPTCLACLRAHVQTCFA